MTSDQDKNAKEILGKLGMEVTEITPAELAKFRNLAQPPVKAWAEKRSARNTWTTSLRPSRRRGSSWFTLPALGYQDNHGDVPWLRTVTGLRVGGGRRFPERIGDPIYESHGIIVALHTPLTPSGRDPREGASRPSEWMVQSASTGSSLRNHGRGHRPVGRAAEACCGDHRRAGEGAYPVMPQVTTNNTRGCLDLARHAREAGCDAISVIAPYFYPSDGPALDAFFTEVAAASPASLSICTTTRPLGLRHLVLLGGKACQEVENIAGIKDSSKDLILFQEYVEVEAKASSASLEPTGWSIRHDGRRVGVVSAVANPFPELMVALYDAVVAKQYERARKLQLLVNQLRGVLKIDPTWPATRRSCGCASEFRWI